MFTDTKNSRRTKADVLTIKFCQKVPHLQSFFQIVILHQFWKSGTRWRQNMEVISHSLTPRNTMLHMHCWYAQPCLPKKLWQVPCFFISTRVNLPYLVHINCLDCISTSENYGMILVLRLSFSKFYLPWQFNGIYLLETASRDNSFKSTVHRSTSLSPADTSTRYWMLITSIICPWRRNTMKQTKKWNTYQSICIQW